MRHVRVSHTHPSVPAGEQHPSKCIFWFFPKHFLKLMGGEIMEICFQVNSQYLMSS